MDEKTREIIKETVIELLDVMGLDVAVEDERIEDIGDEEEIFSINLSTESPSLLIGQYGVNLQCFQHLVNIIVKRKMAADKNCKDNNNEREIKFNIDVNNYKRQKKESLIKLAGAMADQVIYSKNSVALRPMSSYERKIIHMEMANRKNLTTESVGENLTRRVVIKYVEE
jgi:spoIIIJ-associated protein